MMPSFNVRVILRAALLSLFLAGLAFPASGQNTFEETIEKITSDNVRGYIQPMLDGYGANMNSGLSGSARISRMGVTFRLQFLGMGTLIGDAEKNYLATPPEPFAQEPVETATIFGGDGSVATHPAGVQYRFQSGFIDAPALFFFVPQLTVGNIFGTQMTIRYAPVPEIGDFPEVNLFGIGIRHGINQYLPPLPVDFAAGVFYQTLAIGDIIDSKAVAFTAQASRTFLVLTLYGGLQYETTDINLSYYYTGPLPPGDESDRQISIDFKGENKFRATAGLSLALGIMHLNADISVGKVTVISAGLGFGI